MHPLIPASKNDLHPGYEAAAMYQARQARTITSAYTKNDHRSITRNARTRRARMKAIHLPDDIGGIYTSKAKLADGGGDTTLEVTGSWIFAKHTQKWQRTE